MIIKYSNTLGGHMSNRSDCGITGSKDTTAWHDKPCLGNLGFLLGGQRRAYGNLGSR